VKAEMASLHKFFPVKELGGEVESEEGDEGGGGKEKGDKRLSVERLYQRKTQLEHILLRPDTYVGSTEESTELTFVYDAENEAIVKRNVTFVPGLYKIYDEILVNAADNKQRDASMKAIKIVIDPEQNLISVWNGGRGIPVEMHATEKMYVPELIFGTLLTSSNYNDEQKKVTGGRNGYGAKLCNIFSTEFTVETASKESGKSFKQTWKNNMGAAGKVKITSSSSDFTKVTFKPDLAKFKMTHLDSDSVALMTRRAYDLAGCIKGVAVHLNGTRLPVKSFKDYVELYVKGDQSQTEEEIPRKVVYEAVNPRWEVAVTASNHGFQQASFVNSIATTKGGTHVNYIVDQLVSKLLETAKKKNKGGMDLKPFHIKGHLWVFVNCLIENPTFDSQTKETMTLKVKSFGSTCPLSEKFIKQALSCGVVERVLSWARVKSQDKLAQKQKGSKQNKLRGIPKLDDANEAGGRNSHDCTLILTEGDSAKTLAVSGLGVVGRDHYGVFPLRGKLLNVREASHNQLMNNEEITNVVKILGLHYTKKYTDSAELRSLRYGKLLIMTDQDQDGSHIKGLIINFLHHNWPGLLRQSFIQQFITPIVKVSKGSREISFFSLPEFEQWKRSTEGAHTWKVKYYKGLGTSTGKEAKEYFSDMERHRIPFKYSGANDDDAILLAFSKKCVERRKEWLTQWLEHRREQRDQGLDESLLYAEQMDHISYSDFVNKELILFSNMDNERSIPSSVDGLKPGQRKVLFTCFKRNDKREIKVAQLAGSVAEHSAYHHGEQSLMSTIINLAQNFIGSNNINLLQPRGQFGTRLHGGKDAASPRYIFSLLSPLARLLFPVTDDPQLNTLKEDNLR
jgi:DNA topoisomerase-2